MIRQTFSHYKVRERWKAMNTQNVVMILLVLTTSLQAQVIPGRWEKVDSLPTHARLTITLKSGTKENHIFKSSDSENLAVQSAGGAELVIPKNDVTKIVQHKSRSNKHTLIWAAVGDGAGAVPEKTW